MSNYRKVDQAEMRLLRRQKIIERALELVMADLQGNCKCISIARHCKAMESQLHDAALMAYGVSDSERMVERLMGVAMREFARKADVVFVG